MYKYSPDIEPISPSSPQSTKYHKLLSKSYSNDSHPDALKSVSSGNTYVLNNFTVKLPLFCESTKLISLHNIN